MNLYAFVADYNVLKIIVKLQLIKRKQERRTLTYYKGFLKEVLNMENPERYS